MEANYGILSIIPAVIVIGLSLYTKKNNHVAYDRHLHWCNDP